MARYVIPYFEGVNESAGELAGNAAAARLARNVTTDYGRLASAAGASPYIEAPAPAARRACTCSARRTRTASGRSTWSRGRTARCASFGTGQWKTLYTGTAGDWGFLSYKKEDDSILIFGNGVDPVQCWDGASETSAALAGRAGQGQVLCPALRAGVDVRGRGEPGPALLLADAGPERLDRGRGDAGDGRRVCGPADV